MRAPTALEPKKSLGQVFLNDRNLLEKVAELAEARDEIVVEIGAGDGRLTERLARDAKLVYAVEMDRGLFQRLEERFDGSPTVIPLCRNAKELDLSDDVFTHTWGKKVKVVGNLPYCSFVRILLTLMNQMERIEDIRIMAQREIAERLTAVPNTAQYGRLSVTVQARARVRWLLTLPPQAFWPMPKVHSVLLAITPKQPPFASKELLDTFDVFVTAAFAHRRKTLLNSLMRSTTLRDHKELPERLLAEFGFPATCRAQEVPVRDYVNLVNRLTRADPT
ncbi:MAG TPA: 16S rRNA (adenine(1518)-N(6)/adenine(1519)-N(6))-dimethyltransferase RsmA [bacterium]|nr:16S rRNA (adenine(1518)-N(6)/adenine(1519)-N(6))-dimethyltransferase RsmA [bacterium]